MFKSKARKQAEFLLKVEREKERLQQQKIAREAARQKAAEDTQKVLNACINGYKAAYQRHPKTTIIGTVIGGVLILGIGGGIRSNSSEPYSKPVTEPFPLDVAVTPSSKASTKVSNSVTPSVETTPIDKSQVPKTTSASKVTTTNYWGTLHSNDGKINLRTGPGTANKAIGYGVNGDRVQILRS